MSKADDLKAHVPEAISQLKEFTELYNTQGIELDGIYYALMDVVNQCFVSSASWGLSEWERFLKLPTDETLQYDLRRAKVLAKLNQNMQVTPEQMAVIAASASGVNASVAENIDDYTFRVELVSQGKALNIQVVLDAVSEAKPAHLAYEVEVQEQQRIGMQAMVQVEALTKLYFCNMRLCGQAF